MLFSRINGSEINFLNCFSLFFSDVTLSNKKCHVDSFRKRLYKQHFNVSELNTINMMRNYELHFCGVCLTTIIIGILLDINYFFLFFISSHLIFLKNVVQNISL